MKKITIVFFALFSLGCFSQANFKLAANSTLTISGSSTVHDWSVTAHEMTGNLTGKSGAIKAMDFEVTAAAIKSERGPTMDNKMHAAIKVAEYPKIAFKFLEIKNQTTLVGKLALAGVEKQIQIEAQIKLDQNVFGFKGEKKLILQDFAIEPPTAMFGQIIVGDEVIVKFDLFFEPI